MAMPEWIKKELRTNFARASRAGRQAARTEPRAARATYRTKDNVLRIELTNGAAITIPVKLIPALKRASPSEVRSVEVLGRGGGLHWESSGRRSQRPWAGVVGIRGTRMDGRIGSRWRPAIIGGQGGRSPEERPERRAAARSSDGPDERIAAGSLFLFTSHEASRQP